MAIGTVPRSFRLAPVAKYIIDGKSARAARCRLAIWGDSIQEWSNGISGGASYSMGMRNTWKCNWLGAAIHPDAGTDDIVGKHSNLAGAFGSGWSGYSDPVPAISAWAPSTLYALNAIRAPLTPNGFAYKVTSGGTTGSSEPAWPTEIGATVTDGGVTWTAYQLIGNYYPIAAPTKSPSFTPVAVLKTNKNTPDTTGFGTLGLLQVNAQNVKQFHFTGDWTTRALNVSAILYHHPLGMNGSGNGGADTFYWFTTRGGVDDQYIQAQTCYAAGGSESWVAHTAPCKADSGTLGARLQAGAHSTTALVLYWGGTHVSVADQTLNGVELLPIGGNGSATALNCVNIDAQSTANLASWCAAWELHLGSVNMIMFGQNLDATELADIRGVWKTNIRTIINNRRTAIMATAGAIPPLFVLVATPESQAGYSNQVYLDQQQALYELAQENSDVAFINLNMIAATGSVASAAGFFAEGVSGGVHPSRPNSVSSSNLAGIDYYAGLLWAELQYAYGTAASRSVPRLRSFTA